MEKLKSIAKGIGLSTVFILLGIYLLKTSNSIFESIIGIINIFFFGILLLWAIVKIVKNSFSNTH